jgi:hypothetical protein
MSEETTNSFIAPRTEGILAGTDPLAPGGYRKSTRRFEVVGAPSEAAAA